MNSINTGKNVSEIVSSLRAKGFQLDMIPSDISDGIRSSFSAILHSGNGGMLGSHNEPGVKVAIYDLGNSRRVELEALSTSPMGQKFNLKKGEQLCDQLYAELNEGSSVSEPQVEEPAPVSDPTFAPIANDTPAEPEKDDFSKKFMKGFKKISPTAPSAPVAPEPTPVSVAGAAAGFKEMPKPDYVKPSISADKYGAPSDGEATWRCEKCGKVNIGDSRFCGNCGNQRAEKKEEKPTPPSPGSGPKPGPNKKIIIIAAAVVLALVVAIPVISKMSSSPSYDDEYYGEDYDDSYYDESYDDSEMSDDGYYDEGQAIYAEASSQRDSMGDIDYPPENAIDGDLATAWVEGADGDGIGEWISVSFADVDSMNGLWIRNGYQKSEEAYTTNNRVKEVYAEFEDGSVDKFILEDKNDEAQPIFFSEEKPGNTVKLIIKSVYHSEDELDTCITEVELLTAYGSNKPVIHAEKVK